MPYTGRGKTEKKHIRFDVEGDLGDAPTLTQCLTLFLADDMAEEWDDAPGPFTSIPESSPQEPSEDFQCCPINTVEA